MNSYTEEWEVLMRERNELRTALARLYKAVGDLDLSYGYSGSELRTAWRDAGKLLENEPTTVS